jgi:hypothetical protein
LHANLIRSLCQAWEYGIALCVRNRRHKSFGFEKSRIGLTWRPYWTATLQDSVGNTSLGRQNRQVSQKILLVVWKVEETLPAIDPGHQRDLCARNRRLRSRNADVDPHGTRWHLSHRRQKGQRNDSQDRDQPSHNLLLRLNVAVRYLVAGFSVHANVAFVQALGSTSCGGPRAMTTNRNARNETLAVVGLRTSKNKLLFHRARYFRRVTGSTASLPFTRDLDDIDYPGEGF